VVDHGVTGFIFEKDDEAVHHIYNHLSGFSRQTCRRQFEKRFSAERMARDYLITYNMLLMKKAGTKISKLTGIGADLQHAYN